MHGVNGLYFSPGVTVKSEINPFHVKSSADHIEKAFPPELPMCNLVTPEIMVLS